MEINTNHVPANSATEQELWSILITDKDKGVAYLGEISESVYDTINYLQNKIKELENK